MPRLPIALLLPLLACEPEVEVVGRQAFGGAVGEAGPPMDDTDEGDVGDDTDGHDSGTPDEADPPTPCGDLPLGPEGTFLARDTPTAGTRAACTGAWHAVAGAAGSTLALHLDAAEDEALWLQATDLLGAPVGDPALISPGGHTELVLPTSGETLLTLRPDDPGTVDDAPAAYTLRATCVQGCDRPYTRHPVVFLHGMGGTDAYLDTLDYWFGVEPTYADAGLAGAWPAVDALASIDTRARQWADVLAELAADGRGRRFNLIGHSQGGLDARLLAHAHDPERRVASITSVSAPHRGSVVADLADGVLDLTPFDAWLVDAVVAGLAGFVGLEGAELADQVDDLTRDAMARFNEDVPDRADVAYWSWAGASCRGLDFGCQADRDGEIIDPVFSATFRLILLVEGDNDGVVSVESARWGTFLGELPADHMDEVGQIADLAHPAFDAQRFYLDEAARLQAAGL